jgi:hypothetical protein
VVLGSHGRTLLDHLTVPARNRLAGTFVIDTRTLTPGELEAEVRAVFEAHERDRQAAESAVGRSGRACASCPTTTTDAGVNQPRA